MKDMPQSFIDYIQAFNEEAQQRFLMIRNLIFQACDDIEEKISYGIPTYLNHGIIMHVGLFKNHLSIFPSPKTIEHFSSRLDKYQVSKGTIQMPYVIHFDEALIKDIIAYNLNRNRVDKK